MQQIFLLLVLLFSYIPEPKKILFEKCIKPVVMIKSVIDTSTGTGFVVRSQKAINDFYINTVISCAHVCTQKMKIAIPVYNNSSVKKYEEYDAKLLYFNNNLDLSVLIFFSEKKMSTVDIEMNDDSWIDDDVCIIGCGLGESPRLSKGYISGISEETESIRTSISCVPGDSGSPLFKNNKVIGVCLGIKNYNNNLITDISIFRSINKINDIIEKNKLFLINKNDSSIPKLYYFSLLKKTTK